MSPRSLTSAIDAPVPSGPSMVANRPFVHSYPWYTPWRSRYSPTTLPRLLIRNALVSTARGYVETGESAPLQQVAEGAGCADVRGGAVGGAHGAATLVALVSVGCQGAGEVDQGWVAATINEQTVVPGRVEVLARDPVAVGDSAQSGPRAIAWKVDPLEATPIEHEPDVGVCRRRVGRRRCVDGHAGCRGHERETGNGGKRTWRRNDAAEQCHAELPLSETDEASVCREVR